MQKTLKTDREFILLSLPMTDAQQAELEQSLMKNGCTEPIVTWNGVIIDGHKRYRFCMDEGIDYEVKEKAFDSAVEAVSWVCRQRISDVDKDTPAYRYLAGRLYNAQKDIFRVIRQQPEAERSICLNPEWNRVSEYVADELKYVNRTTIEVYGGYAMALDQIAEKAKGLFEAILAGKVVLSKKKTREYAALEKKQLSELCWKKWGIAEPIDQSHRLRERTKRNASPQVSNGIPLSVGIKDMPAYDPDMELRGLVLTIPTWIMAISRAEKKTGQATEHAKEQLAKSLLKLQAQIEKMMGVLNRG